MVGLMLLAFVLMGIAYAPFDWDLGVFPRNPVAVDAISDIGENQQIVFTKWSGRSPQDVDDQITYTDFRKISCIDSRVKPFFTTT